MVYRLSQEEGVLVGQSSGAALFAALQVARKLRSGTIVTIFPDFGDKYLTTNLWVGWRDRDGGRQLGIFDLTRWPRKQNQKPCANESISPFPKGPDQRTGAEPVVETVRRDFNIRGSTVTADMATSGAGNRRQRERSRESDRLAQGQRHRRRADRKERDRITEHYCTAAEIDNTKTRLHVAAHPE